MEVGIYYGGGNFLRSFISYHVIFEPNVWLPKQQSNFFVRRKHCFPNALKKSTLLTHLSNFQSSVVKRTQGLFFQIILIRTSSSHKIAIPFCMNSFSLDLKNSDGTKLLISRRAPCFYPALPTQRFQVRR